MSCQDAKSAEIGQSEGAPRRGPSPFCLGVVGALAAHLLFSSGCGDDSAAAPGDGADAGSGAASPYDAGSDAAGGGTGGVEADAGDAGVSPVYLGITANTGTDAPTVGEIVEAELVTFAAGVRVVTAHATWRDLDQPGAVADLAQRVVFWTEHGQRVLVDLALVDRAADGRPDAVAALPWDDAATQLALDTTVDALLDAAGPGLSYLTFGRDVDAFLGAHAADRAAFEALAAHAIGHAKAHAMAPPELRLGVGFSFAGATKPHPSVSPLWAASDVAVVSYAPGLDDGAAGPASAVTTDLDELVQAAAGLPIVVAGVSYPSAPEVGSSDEAQKLFYTTLFGALAARRPSFDVVDVERLHDPSPAACEAEATAQGEDPAGAWAAYACSTGLFDADGAKPAWSPILAAAATFAAP